MELFDSSKTRATVMEKILRQADLTEGFIPVENISKLIQNLYPGVPVDKKRLEEIKKQHDIQKESILDFDCLMKILVSFLLQQSTETDQLPAINTSDDSALTISELIPFCNM